MQYRQARSLAVPMQARESKVASRLRVLFILLPACLFVVKASANVTQAVASYAFIEQQSFIADRASIHQQASQQKASQQEVRSRPFGVNLLDLIDVYSLTGTTPKDIYLQLVVGLGLQHITMSANTANKLGTGRVSASLWRKSQLSNSEHGSQLNRPLILAVKLTDSDNIQETRVDTPKPLKTKAEERTNSQQAPNEPAETNASQTISSLAQTVENLSQELALKNQAIDQLEAEIALLKQLQQRVESNDASSASQNRAPSDAQSDLAASNSYKSKIKDVWLWLLVATLALVTIVLIVFRTRLARRQGYLNLAGSSYEIAVADQDSDLQGADLVNRNLAAEKNRHNDLAFMQEVEQQLNQDDSLQGSRAVNTEQNPVSDDASSIDHGAHDTDLADQPNDAELSFEERFEYLLEQQDFAFARELLEFARYSEINDERYHCERLRLLKCMDDEDGFYEYYYEIESKIPSFPASLQTQISQFVVQLANSS